MVLLNLLYSEVLYSQNREELSLIKKHELTIIEIQKLINENNSSEIIFIKQAENYSNKVKDDYCKNRIELLIASKLIFSDGITVEKILFNTKKYVQSHKEYEHLTVQFHYVIVQNIKSKLLCEA